MKTRKLRIKRKVVVKSRKKGKLNRKISNRRKQKRSRNISKKHNRTRKNRVMRGGTPRNTPRNMCYEQLSHYFQEPDKATEYLLEMPSNKQLCINKNVSLVQYITPDENIGYSHLTNIEAKTTVVFSHKHFIKNYVKKFVNNFGDFDMDNGDYICLQKEGGTNKYKAVNYNLKKKKGFPMNKKTVDFNKDDIPANQEKPFLILVRHCYRYCQDYDSTLALVLHDPMCNEDSDKVYKQKSGIINLKKLLDILNDKNICICSSTSER